jgi:hypothetical protein
MTSFKQYYDDLILEKSKISAKWQRSAVDLSKEESINLPLTPTVSKALGWFHPMLVAHFTDSDGLINVLDSQNTRRRQLSTTTSFEKNFLGVQSMGNALILKGRALFGRRSDMGSLPDNGGLRWIPITTILKNSRLDIEDKTDLKSIVDGSKDVNQYIKALEAWFLNNISKFYSSHDIFIDSAYGYNEVVVDNYEVVEAIVNWQYVESERKFSQITSRLKVDSIPYRTTKTTQEFHDIMNEWQTKLG